MPKAASPLSFHHWQSWQKCLYDETDHNSLANQILTFNYYDAIYRMTLEDRRYLIKRFPDDPPLNQEFCSFVDHVYFESQMMRLRRIRDTENSFINERTEKDVCSIYAILNDIKSHRFELTRKCFLNFHFPKVLTAASNNVSEESKLEDAQYIFDIISGTHPTSRSDTDIPAEVFFTELEVFLNSTNTVIDHIDKFTAHLATPANRQSVLSVDKLPYTDAIEAYKTIYLVYAILFYVVHIELPFLFRAPFANLTKHWQSVQLDPKQEVQLQNVYKKFALIFLDWNETDVQKFKDDLHSKTATEFKRNSP